MSALDWTIHSYFLGIRTDFLTTVIVPFTKATGPTVMAVLAIAYSLFLVLNVRKGTEPLAVALTPAVSVIAANLVSFLLKRLINRDRPPLQGQLLYHYNPSMPSGHAVGAFALATAIALTTRKTWTIILFCVAALIAMLRLYVGVHWFSDILVGAVVGISTVVIIAQAMKRTTRVTVT